MDLAELRDEIDRLRNRKAELEDIIQARETNGGKKIDPAAIETMFRESAEEWAPDRMKEILRRYVQKIYADPDGSYTVEIGVHISGCGGWI